MPVRRIAVTESFAGIDLGERRAREDYATIPGAGWSRTRLDALRDALQASIDLRVPRAGLPDGDPDKAADPALGERPFRDGGDLVARTAGTDAGTDHVVGASVSFDDVTPAAAVPFLSLREGAAEFLRLELTTGGDVLVVDANAAVEVFIDDAGQGSDSAQDPTDAGSALDLSTWDPAIGNIFTGNSARLPGG